MTSLEAAVVRASCADLAARPESEPRFVFIDALRGIAALAVVICHVPVTPLHDALVAALSSRVVEGMEAGQHGVELFFVISGFVIAHSLRRTPLTAAGIGNFSLRRQLRLDPPYWAILFLTLLLVAVTHHLSPARTPSVPAASTILLNMLYLHRILNVTNLVSVSWTLCIEIQFYLFFSLLMLVTQAGAGLHRLSRVSTAALFLTGAVSLGFRPPILIQPWMVSYWCFFAAGAFSYFVYRGQVPAVVLWLFLLLMAVADGWWYGFHPSLLAGAGSAGLVYLVGRANRLTNLWSGPIVQYFGRISYSLYLAHWPVKTVVMDLGFHLTRNRPVWAMIWSFLTIALSIGAAHVLHHAVERPSMRLAAYFRPKAKLPTLPSPIAAGARGELSSV